MKAEKDSFEVEREEFLKEIEQVKNQLQPKSMK